MFVRVQRAPKALWRAGLAALMAISGFGAAQAAGTRIGWVWADQPSAVGTYTPNTDFSFNSAGGDVSINNSATGVSTVTFANLKSSDATNVLVTAYNSNGYCVSSSWGADGSGESITVRCFDAAGAPSNSHFTLLYQARAGNFGTDERGMAFLWANQQSAASYTPDLTYQYNSTGGTNTITRNSVGSYTVHIPGLDKIGGHVQVAAYADGAARCKTTGWDSGVDGTDIGVACFDASGAASDQRFTLEYARSMPLAYLSATQTRGVYAWTDKPKALHTYKPSKIYQFNSLTNGRLTADRSAKGVYAVHIPGSTSYDSSNMLVTAYGAEDNNYCNVVNWEPLLVNCYRQGGHASDSNYDVSFQTRH